MHKRGLYIWFLATKFSHLTVEDVVYNQPLSANFSPAKHSKMASANFSVHVEGLFKLKIGTKNQSTSLFPVDTIHNPLTILVAQSA